MSSCQSVLSAAIAGNPFFDQKYSNHVLMYSRTEDQLPLTLGVLIFAGTNFREFFSPYIRGYLFSRMSFYSTFAGTNFREWVVSIANFLGKYVDE